VIRASIMVYLPSLTLLGTWVSVIVGVHELLERAYVKIVEKKFAFASFGSCNFGFCEIKSTPTFLFMHFILTNA
jgi:hypothetical protein